MDAIWSFLNSGIGLVLVASVILYVGRLVFTKKPEWKVLLDKYQGSLIAAVKFAEKAIPDNTPEKGLAKLDNALKYMSTVYETTTGMAATPNIQADLKQAIIVTHDQLEQQGAFPKTVTATASAPLEDKAL